MRLSILLILVLSCVLISCGVHNDQTVEFPSTSPENASDEVPATVIIDIPTPDKNTGVITGRIISVDSGEPIVRQVYLGEIIPLTPGPDIMITLGVAASLHTRSDSNGRFLFTEVEPGDYPLIIFSSSKSLVIPDASGEEALIVTVKPGEIVDLGDLQLDWTD